VESQYEEEQNERVMQGCRGVCRREVEDEVGPVKGEHGVQERGHP
jgi:hypothetical protein